MKLCALMVGWALIGVALRFQLWPAAVIVALLGIVWLYRSQRRTELGKTLIGTILGVVGWAAASLLAWVALYVVFLVVATVGAGFGWWGSPWDGR
jgi:glucose uptake protein GlcU